MLIFSNLIKPDNRSNYRKSLINEGHCTIIISDILEKRGHNMQTIFATSIGIDNIHMTWSMMFWLSVTISSFLLLYLVMDRLSFMMKRQPVYKLINKPSLIKETIRDCFIGKTLESKQDRRLFNVVVVIMTIYVFLVIFLLIIKGICLKHGISEEIINSSEITTLLQYL